MVDYDAQFLVNCTLVLSLLGFVIHLKPLWKMRVIVIAPLIAGTGALIGLFLVSNLSLWFISLMTIVLLYRVFAYLRVVKSRRRFDHAVETSLRTELTLSIVLFAIIITHQANELFALELHFALIFASAQFVAAVILFQNVWQSFSLTKFVCDAPKLNDNRLPSITVAVPARNEDEDLSKCLMSIVASNYPKLEVLALDDCSQDKTSDIIRRFAHQGVRFLQGKMPPDSWLAKNNAYQQLLDESEGKYVVFCGTDVRFGPKDLRSLIEYMEHNNLKMMSVLPIRESRYDAHYVFQPMRYWRELAFFSLARKYPPAISTVWIVERAFLEKLGGFSAFRKAIRPEKIIAKSAHLLHGYRFIRSADGLLIRSCKNLRAQWNTAVRTRYPEHRNRPEYVCLSTLSQLFIFVGPLALTVYGVLKGDVYVVVLSLLSSFLLLVCAALIVRMSTGTYSISRVALFPLSIITELYAINYSMWAYEFSEVVWKGRNICIPVLRATASHLPKLS